jgi:two-component system OmpR family response regulator
MRLLVVEDDQKMADLLQRALVRDGYAVDVVGNGTDALWSATENTYDAIVLDAMIPAPDGFEVSRRLRADQNWVPVLMLTARDAVSDRVFGLDAGADDYLTKPFALEEFLARVRAVSRRDPAPRPEGIRAAPTLDAPLRGGAQPLRHHRSRVGFRV